MFPNEQTEQNLSYTLVNVNDNGNCGIEAYDITRKEASTVLKQKITNNKIAKQLASAAYSLLVDAKLLTNGAEKTVSEKNNFYLFLEENGLLNTSVNENTLSECLTIQENLDHDGSQKEQEEIRETFLTIFKNSKFLHAYIDFTFDMDEQEPAYSNRGWLHINDLCALAIAQDIKLRIWEKNESEELVLSINSVNLTNDNLNCKDIYFDRNKQHFQKIIINPNQEEKIKKQEKEIINGIESASSTNSDQLTTDSDNNVKTQPEEKTKKKVKKTDSLSLSSCSTPGDSSLLATNLINDLKPMQEIQINNAIINTFKKIYNQSLEKNAIENIDDKIEDENIINSFLENIKGELTEDDKNNLADFVEDKRNENFNKKFNTDKLSNAIRKALAIHYKQTKNSKFDPIKKEFKEYYDNKDLLKIDIDRFGLNKNFKLTSSDTPRSNENNRIIKQLICDEDDNNSRAQNDETILKPNNGVNIELSNEFNFNKKNGNESVSDETNNKSEKPNVNVLNLESNYIEEETGTNTEDLEGSTTSATSNSTPRKSKSKKYRKNLINVSNNTHKKPVNAENLTNESNNTPEVRNNTYEKIFIPVGYYNQYPNTSPTTYGLMIPLVVGVSLGIVVGLLCAGAIAAAISIPLLSAAGVTGLVFGAVAALATFVITAALVGTVSGTLTHKILKHRYTVTENQNLQQQLSRANNNTEEKIPLIHKTNGLDKKNPLQKVKTYYVDSNAVDTSQDSISTNTEDSQLIKRQ